MLELVATMPSRPLGPRVLVTLDIVSRSIRLTVAETTRGSARGMQLSFIPQKALTFQTAWSVRRDFRVGRAHRRNRRAVLGGTHLLLRASPAAYSKRFVHSSLRNCSRSS